MDKSKLTKIAEHLLASSNSYDTGCMLLQELINETSEKIIREIPDSILSCNFPDDPEFREYIELVPDGHWSKYDLSAVRLGWELQKLT